VSAPQEEAPAVEQALLPALIIQKKRADKSVCSTGRSSGCGAGTPACSDHPKKEQTRVSAPQEEAPAVEQALLPALIIQKRSRQECLLHRKKLRLWSRHSCLL
jgi:hypothetical protein